ncbi:MAG: hypothetical protein ACI4XH_05825 [Acutalibacteraceae bacterium]
MKNKKAIVICSVIAAMVLIAGIAAGVITASHKKAVESETTQANSDIVAVNQSTASSETTQANSDIGAVNQSTASSETTKTQPKKHYAPKNIELNDNGYNIVWSKDDKLSLRIESVNKDYDGQSFYEYFDVTINEYGELVKAQMYEYDKVKKTATPIDYYETKELKYNDLHQLVENKSITKNDYEGQDVRIDTYIYDSEGHRIKNEVKMNFGDGESSTYYMEYTYENGWLKKLYVPGFYEGLVDDESRVDKVDVFYYDFNDLNLPSKMYIAYEKTFNEEEAKKPDNANVYSYEYDEVSQAQEKFYYNTLIYLIEDYNASFL